MQEDYMKTQLREAIFREVTAYISEVYADDTHFNDCIFVRTYDEEVSHGRRSHEEYEDGYQYFDMFPLLNKPSTFTFEPNPVGIEVVVNKFYPDERISKFVEDAKATINEFLKTHGYSEDAELSFPIDTFKTYVCCSSEIETYEVGDSVDFIGLDEDLVECVSRPLRKFVRNTRDRGFIVQEDRLESLAAEMLLEYDDFMKSDTKK